MIDILDKKMKPLKSGQFDLIWKIVKFQLEELAIWDLIFSSSTTDIMTRQITSYPCPSNKVIYNKIKGLLIS